MSTHSHNTTTLSNGYIMASIFTAVGSLNDLIIGGASAGSKLVNIGNKALSQMEKNQAKDHKINDLKKDVEIAEQVKGLTDKVKELGLDLPTLQSFLSPIGDEDVIEEEK